MNLTGKASTLALMSIRLTAMMLIAITLGASPAAAEWVQKTGETMSIWSDAGTTIKDEYAREDVMPRMEIRCEQGGALAARIDWGRFISSFSTEVGFKVDNGNFIWLKWKVDGSEKITLSPSADDSRRLLTSMSGGKTLTVDVAPYSEGPIVVTFDLAGFTEVLDSLRADCQ